MNTLGLILPNLYESKPFIFLKPQIFELVMRLLLIYFYTIKNISNNSKNSTNS